MADKNNKTPNNAPGPFFVDQECTGCGLCVDTAPENFELDDDGLAHVTKQPEDDDQKANCQDALDNCPVEAIGNDG